MVGNELYNWTGLRLGDILGPYMLSITAHYTLTTSCPANLPIDGQLPSNEKHLHFSLIISQMN